MPKLTGVDPIIQVHPESAECKVEWLKCLSDGGAFVPTIKALTKLGDAKKQLNRLRVHQRNKLQEREYESKDHEQESQDHNHEEEDSAED